MFLNESRPTLKNTRFVLDVFESETGTEDADWDLPRPNDSSDRESPDQ